MSRNPQEKQPNQDELRKASSAKDYRKTHPDIGLKYWRNLLDAVRGLYVERIQRLVEK